MLRIDAGPAIATHVRRHATESEFGKHRQLVTPADRQFGPTMQEADDRRVGGAAGKVGRRMTLLVHGVLGNRKWHSDYSVCLRGKTASMLWPSGSSTNAP